MRSPRFVSMLLISAILARTLTESEERPEVDRETAERHAQWEAKEQADKEAREVEERCRMTPPLLTSDELHRQLKSAHKFKAITDQMIAEIETEMTRRELA